MKNIVSITLKYKALFLAFVISRFYYCKNDKVAYFKSLITSKPVSRKYDCWYYKKGKLISRYTIVVQNEKNL